MYILALALLQVINHISTLHELPSLAEAALPSGSKEENVYKKMLWSRKSLRYDQ